MHFIINSSLSDKTKEKLETFGSIIQLSSNDITYDSISNHPDIFICSSHDKLIIAQNAPLNFINHLENQSISFCLGDSLIKLKYPNTCNYNAVVTDQFLIHNLKYTDSEILNACVHIEHIHVEQGYTRCNLLPLKNNHFITSDKGIEKELIKHKLHVLYVNPTDIILAGMKHGFFGGCCGIYNDTIFINGSLSKLHDGHLVKNYLQKLNYKIIELRDMPLEDCGSIIVVSS